MKRILWQSQHRYLPSQEAELRRLFGEVEIVPAPPRFTSAEEIRERYRQGGYDDLVVVAPLSVLAQLVDLGLRPLWAEMVQVPTGQSEVQARGRHYRFLRFRRVRALRLEFDELE